MAEMKSAQLVVSMEPTLAKLVRENTDNTSAYIRGLVIKDLLGKELITMDKLAEVLV